MLKDVEKTVIQAPFRGIPKPPWFTTSRVYTTAIPRLVELEAHPSIRRIPGVLTSTLKS
jgi:hypothetical protein